MVIRKAGNTKLFTTQDGGRELEGFIWVREVFGTDMLCSSSCQVPYGVLIPDECIIQRLAEEVLLAILCANDLERRCCWQAFSQSLRSQICLTCIASQGTQCRQERLNVNTFCILLPSSSR